VVQGVERQFLAGREPGQPATGVAGEAQRRRVRGALPGEGDRLLADHDLGEARQRVPGAVEVPADAAQGEVEHLDLVEALPSSERALQPGQLRGRLQQPATGRPHPGAQQPAGLPASSQGSRREGPQRAEQGEVEVGRDLGGRR
jgi:hypothetical protein